MGTTDRFAEFIVNTRFADVPKETVAIAKGHFMDTLGTMLGGSVEAPPKLIEEFVKEIGGTREAGIIGAGFRTSAPNAALANGSRGHILDYDDAGLGGHISVCIVPATLALGEKLHLSGKDVLAAYIIGFEVFARIFSGSEYVQYGRLHSTAQFGHMGAAAAAAKELALSVQQVKMALGIVTSEVSGVHENSGTMVKSFHAGNAAKNGVVAAMLAKKGYCSADNIIESPEGFLNTFVGQGKYDLEKMTKNLGKPFMIYSPGSSIKKYPCCFMNHRALDAILSLMQEHDITYDQVKGVEAEVSPTVLKSLRFAEPKNGLQGKFSLNYNMASAILDRKIVRSTFTDSRVLEPRTKEALKKIKVTVHPEWPDVVEKSPYPVTITMKNGKVYRKNVDVPKGAPTNRLTWQELVDKFRDNASVVLSGRQTTRAVNLVKDIEDVKDIAQLMAILTKKAAPVLV